MEESITTWGLSIFVKNSGDQFQILPSLKIFHVILGQLVNYSKVRTGMGVFSRIGRKKVGDNDLRQVVSDEIENRLILADLNQVEVDLIQVGSHFTEITSKIESDLIRLCELHSSFPTWNKSRIYLNQNFLFET